VAAEEKTPRAEDESPAPTRAAYTLRQTAVLLGLPIHRVRTLARAAGIDPGVGLGFQDLVLLRSLAGLVAARISPRRVAGALAGLRGQAPGQPLSRVQLSAEGRAIVARDDTGLFEPLSGQRCLDFAPRPAPSGALTPFRPRPTPPPSPPPESESAETWYERGVELEETAPPAAVEAYRRALALDPQHADAHINVGRLMHEAGELAVAEAHYRAALAARPDDSTARFNLGVVLDDSGRADEAIAAYRAALEIDPGAADAHFNLARLYESRGDKLAAIRHLSRYRALTKR
jgi:tetratricopeptide (TPR) repeat protein